ncbi:MAG: ABC transporter ATP-binding protein [Thermoproteota archaeon]
MRVENVSKIFEMGGQFVRKKYICAIDKVSFSMRKGDTLALIGESGCGKSTLGRLILGVLKPTSGRILYQEKDIWSMSKSEFKAFRRNVQIVHQDPYQTFNPMRTVYQSLSPALLHYKIAGNDKEARQKAAELLELVNLMPPDDFLGRYPHTLSGGQLQRIAIARAISVAPKLLVADEAVSMLDASLRIEILNLLLDMKKRFDLTCLFITHDFGVARYFASDGKVMVMYLGSIVEVGPTENVLLKPLHPYTKAMIDSVPIPDPKFTRSRGLPLLRSLEIPRLTEFPSGCKFHTRCPKVKEICTQKFPELKEIEKGHFVACHQMS